MKPIRSNSIYVSDKTLFYAHILAKAKMNGIKADMTIDQLCDAELTDKWEREYPQLPGAYEINCQIRLDNKKKFSEAEKEVISSLVPMPGCKNLKEVV